MHDICSFFIGSVVFFLLICSSSYFPYSKPWLLTFIVEIFSSNLDLHFKNTQKIFFSFSLFCSFFFLVVLHVINFIMSNLTIFSFTVWLLSLVYGSFPTLM